MKKRIQPQKENYLSKEKICQIIGKNLYNLKDMTYEDHVKVIEYRMGMTVEAFHDKLDALLTPEYIAKTEENFQILEQWLEDDKIIITQKRQGGGELILSDGEYFVPCFHPDIPIRNEMPNHWFISNYGNLITVVKGKVWWMPPHVYSDGLRSCHKWTNPVTKRTTSMMTYAIINVVCGSAVFGESAAVYMERFGSFCFGVKGDPYNVESHHILRLEDYPELVNDPENIQNMLVRVHDLLRMIRIHWGKILHIQDPVRQQKAIDKITGQIKFICDLEAPGKIVRISNGLRFIDGQYLDDKGMYQYEILTEFSAPEGDQRQYITYYPETGAVIYQLH